MSFPTKKPTKNRPRRPAFTGPFDALGHLEAGMCFFLKQLKESSDDNLELAAWPEAVLQNNGLGGLV